MFDVLSAMVALVDKRPKISYDYRGSVIGQGILQTKNTHQLINAYETFAWKRVNVRKLKR